MSRRHRVEAKDRICVMILRVVTSTLRAGFYAKNTEDPWPALPSSLVLRRLGRGTPEPPEAGNTPRKSTDLELMLFISSPLVPHPTRNSPPHRFWFWGFLNRIAPCIGIFRGFCMGISGGQAGWLPPSVSVGGGGRSPPTLAGLKKHYLEQNIILEPKNIM